MAEGEGFSGGNDIEELKFSDLFDLVEIQRLQDSFADAHNVASIITDNFGVPITRESNFTHFCSNIIRQTEQGRANCYNSDAALGRCNLCGPNIQPCLSAGLYDAGATISVGGKHIASWLIGQVRTEETNEQEVMEYADRIGADRVAFFNALQQVPHLSLEKFTKIANLLKILATQLSDKAYANFLLKKEIKEHEVAKEKLNESVINLNVTLNSIGDGVISTDINGSVCSMNPVAEHLCGWRLQDALGKPIADILRIENADRKTALSSIQKVLELGQVQVGSNKLVLLSKNELRYIISINASPIKNNNGKVQGVVLVFSDVTDSHNAVETLAKSEKKFHSLFENTIAGVALHNLVFNDNGKPINYIISDVNPAFETILGISKESVVGKLSTDAYGVSDPPYFETYAKVAITGEPTKFETYFAPLQKNFLISVYCPYPNSFATTFEDITEQTLDKNKLRNSETRLQNVLKGSGLGYWDWNLLTGEVKRNQRWAEMLGYQIEDIEFSLKQWIDFVHPDDREMAMMSVNDHIEGKTDMHRLEYRMRTKNGDYRWILDLAQAVEWDENGKVLRVSGVHSDITEQKLADEKLKISLAKYCALFHAFPLGVIVSDADAQIVEMNSNAKRMLGLTSLAKKGLILGDSSFQIIRPDGSRMPFDEYPGYVSFKENRLVTNVTMGIPKPNNEVTWLSTSAVPINLEGFGVLVVYNDITEIKQTEESLYREQIFTKSLLDSLPGIFYLYSYPDLRLLRWNKNHETIFGFSANELSGMDIDKWANVYYKEKIKSAMFEVFEKGHARIEAELYTKSGRAIPFILSGVKMEVHGKKYVMGVGSDITERKQMEIALREREEKYRFLTEFASDVIWELNLSKQRFSYISPSVMQLRGYTVDEAMAQTLTESLSHESALYIEQAINNNVAKFFDDPTVTENYVYQIQQPCKDGSLVWVEISTKIRTNALGEVEIVGVSRNINERKQVEQELRTSKEKIKLQNEKLRQINAEKDKFFSILAHDLRSPFNSFLGLTQIMADDLPSLTMSQIQEIAFRMSNSANNLYRLLDNLLQWAQMQQGLLSFNPVSVHLSKLIEATLDTFNEMARNKDIKIGNFVYENVKVYCDMAMLQVVVRNLVSNAIKFTPKGGKISIKHQFIDNNMIQVMVIDNGIGMSNTLLNNLFYLGEKTSRKGTEGESSTGLGLNLCKDFVERNGGNIWVESKENVGSTFFFTLKMVD